MKKYLLKPLMLLFVSYQGYGQLDFAVELRLKPQTDKRYLATENPLARTSRPCHVA